MAAKDHIKVLEDFLDDDKKGYTYSLCDISKTKDLTERVEIIADHIEAVLKTIEDYGHEYEVKREIERFVVGKTFVRKPYMEMNSWKRDGGINGRWTSSYKKDNYDGLVVVCAVTYDMLNDTGKNDSELFNHQYYTIAIKQQLIHHFVYTKQDQRLDNTSFYRGKMEEEGAYAYVIYIAYKFEGTED